MDLVLDDDMIAHIIAAINTTEIPNKPPIQLQTFGSPPLLMVSLPDPETHKISVTYINKKLL